MSNKKFGTSNFELEDFIKLHPPKKSFGKFLGVFPSDRLPIIKKPACLIANYDEFGMGGSHWVAMAFPVMGSPLYFDSYGKMPEHWEDLLGIDIDFKKYLRENSKNGSYIYNKFNFQQFDNDACGEYCIYFLMNGAPSNMGQSNPSWIKIRNIPQPKRDSFIIKLLNLRR